MKIVMVAGDFTESAILEKVKVALEVRGHKIQAFLAHGKPPTYSKKDVEKAIEMATDIVFLAVSNNLDETLHAGETARRLGIPFGIYAGGQPGCYEQSDFRHLRTDARFVFVFSDKELGPAKTLFPQAQITSSSSPFWEEFFFPELSRDDARKRLGLEDEKTVILCPGDKDIVLNSLLFGLTIEAAHDPALVGSIGRVILSLHPGDRTPFKDYANLGVYSSKVPVTFVSREMPVMPESVHPKVDVRVMSTSQALSGADVLVTFISTLGYEAACQRKPVINFFFEYGEARLESYRGHRRWEQCENGTSASVHHASVVELAGTIKVLLTREGFGPMRRRQEEVYPKPSKRGTSVETIVKALEAVKTG